MEVLSSPPPSDLPPPPPSSSLLLSSIAILGPALPSSTSFSPERDLPFLPNEIKREILRFCDCKTLGKTSLVSLAFLELSSPILYDDVEVLGFQNLHKLFSARDASHLPHLEPFLSITRIRSLSFAPTPLDDTEVESLPLSRDRLQSEGPLALDSLTLFVLPVLDKDDRTDIAWDEITSFVDPRTVHLVGLPIRLSVHLPGIYLPTPTWSNLSLLRLVDCTNDFAINWNCLHGTTKDVIVILGSEGWRRVAGLPVYESTFAETSRVLRVVVRSKSKEHSRGVQGEVRLLWETHQFSDEEIARRNEMITYEVVGEGES